MRRLPSLPAAAFRTLARLASGAGSDAALLVLTYHRVVAQPDCLAPGEPDAAEFAAQMDVIRDAFNVLPLGEAVALRKAQKLPARSLCITFDDGYANNAEIALPVLASRGLRATFFVATGFMDGGMMWNDRVIESVRCAAGRLDLCDLGLGEYVLTDAASRRAAIRSILQGLKYREQGERELAAQALGQRAALPDSAALMMSRQQVRGLVDAGMEVGAHTITHPILSRLAPQAAMHEIAASREQLREMTGAEVRSFAYPNGRPGSDYGREHVNMVRSAGFACAVSTAWGAAGRDADDFQLPRVAPWDRSTWRYLTRLLRAYRQRRPALA